MNKIGRESSFLWNPPVVNQSPVIILYLYSFPWSFFHKTDIHPQCYADDAWLYLPFKSLPDLPPPAVYDNQIGSLVDAVRAAHGRSSSSSHLKQ